MDRAELTLELLLLLLLLLLWRMLVVKLRWLVAVIVIVAARAELGQPVSLEHHWPPLLCPVPTDRATTILITATAIATLVCTTRTIIPPPIAPHTPPTPTLHTPPIPMPDPTCPPLASSTPK